jgi:hypothetical protein
VAGPLSAAAVLRSIQVAQTMSMQDVMQHCIPESPAAEYAPIRNEAFLPVAAIETATIWRGLTIIGTSHVSQVTRRGMDACIHCILLHFSV